jgi:DNA-binding IclR family transcriptional regulator
MAKDDDEGGKARSLQRGLAVLELFLDRPGPLTVTDVMRELEIPRTTAFQIVRVLRERGYLVSHGPRGGFVLGRRLYRLSLSFLHGSALFREGEPAVAALRDETEETVQLAALEQGRCMTLLAAPGSKVVSIAVTSGEVVPVNWSAAGIVLLAGLARPRPTELSSMIAPSPTGLAPTAPEAVLRLAELGDRQGYLLTSSFQHEKVVCLSAPLRDHAGRPLASLSLLAYEPSLDDSRVRSLVETLCRRAGELERKLGD